jgi:hypothetical protein
MRENSNLAVIYYIRQKIINIFQTGLDKDYLALLPGTINLDNFI